MALKVIGHRGARVEAPENTLRAFQLAVDGGADMIEVDVHLTADGEVVIMHDYTLERMTGHDGTIADMAWPELQQAVITDDRWPEVAEGIPTLAQTLDLCARGRIEINIEIKTPKNGEPAIVDAVHGVVAAAGFPPDKVLVSSFSDMIVRYVATHYPQYGLAALFLKHPSDLAALPGTVIHPPVKLINADFMAAAKQAGKAVNAWTINEPDVWQRMADLGVDGITTDDPRGLRRWLMEEKR